MKRGWIILMAAAGWLAAGLASASASNVEMTIVVGDTARTVTITLDEEAAPQTCANFKKLCAEQFYSGILFHRVIPDYIVQAGDPLTRDPSKKADWGTGGTPNAIPGEFNKLHARGAVAAARLGDARNPTKASHASQFYIALREIPALDGEYTVFGNVTSGLEFLDQIASLAADENNIPLAKVEIRSMKVTDGSGTGVPPIPDLTTNTATTPAAGTGTTTTGAAPTPAPDPSSLGDRGLPPMPRLSTTSLEPTGTINTAPAPAPAPAPTEPAAPPTPSPGAAAPAISDRGLPPMPRLATTPSGDPAPAPVLTPTTPAAADPSGSGLALPSVATPSRPADPSAAGADPNLPLAGEFPGAEAAPAQPAAAPSGEPKKEPGFFGRLIRRVW